MAKMDKNTFCRGLVAIAMVALLSFVSIATADINVDFGAATRNFEGIGGLSGGGATSVLLDRYPKQQKDEIFDFLFKPKFGASLQVVKVEIGGDSQSTDGTETSHMHSKDDVNFERGYEWKILVEAKKRNPNIKTYGLAWAYPGWIGGAEQNPSPFSHPDLTAQYIVTWLKGALDVYGIRIDYVGIWNERKSNSTYVQVLRREMDKNGFASTKIVAKDGYRDICDELKLDPEYQEAVDIIGLHYPSDYDNYTTCHSLQKPIWASEESSSYDDLNGAACWARVITSHFALNQMTSSIMWNLVGSYYHGTNWYASSLLTANQPWSGYYEKDMPVVWATAHVTQFTEPFTWKYLDVGHGSGELPKGGFYTSFINAGDSNNTDGHVEFTMVVVKISRDHAPCTRPPLPDFRVEEETVTFHIKNANGGYIPNELHVWYSNFEKNVKNPTVFENLESIKVNNGMFTLTIPVGGVYTVSTVTDARKGSFAGNLAPASTPQFPLPYHDDFQSYLNNSEAMYFADQIGAFEIHPKTLSQEPSGPEHTEYSMRQMVPEIPIGWQNAPNGPMTLIGMIEWQDITVATEFFLPVSAFSNTSACVATRVDQLWLQGIVFCVEASGKWTLSQGGPPLSGDIQPKNIIQSGAVSTAPGLGSWHSLSLTTVNDTATASFDKERVFSGLKIRNFDNGFAALGCNQWHPVEFGSISINRAGNGAVHRWSEEQRQLNLYDVGDSIGVEDCPTNGIKTASTSFLLRPDWLLEHISSGLCVEAASAKPNAAFTLQKCESGKLTQELRNDYTNIRNNLRPLTLGGYKKLAAQLKLSGDLNGTVSLSGAAPGTDSGWNTWVYYPNTNQLRNQYNTVEKLGYPKCLSVGK